MRCAPGFSFEKYGPFDVRAEHLRAARIGRLSVSLHGAKDLQDILWAVAVDGGQRQRGPCHGARDGGRPWRTPPRSLPWLSRWSAAGGCGISMNPGAEELPVKIHHGFTWFGGEQSRSGNGVIFHRSREGGPWASRSGKMEAGIGEDHRRCHSGLWS